MANLETAAAIYKFFINMPDLCLKSVYKEIVEDCFRLAELCPVDEARELLIKSICDNYEENGNGLKNHNLPIFTKWVRRNKSEKSRGEVESDIEKAIKERDYDMLSRLLMDDILYKDEVVSLYELFIIKSKVEIDPRIIPCDQQTRLKTCIHDIVDEEESDDEQRKVDVVESNPFRMLGFVSFYSKCWAAVPDPNAISSKTMLYNFYNEYCLGYIMDCVFDTIYKCNVTMLSRELWNYMKKTTEKNPVFCDITQKRFDEYRKFYPQIQKVVFKCENNDNNKDTVGPLPELKGYNLDYTFKLLVDCGCLKDDQKEIFTKKLFVGITGPEIEKIHWYETAGKLAYFLRKVRDKYKYLTNDYWSKKDNYYRYVCNIFVKENGQPFDEKTLAQDSKCDESFKKLDFFKLKEK